MVQDLHACELHIQDPVDPSNDLGSPTYSMHKVRDMFWICRKDVGQKQAEGIRLLDLLVSQDVKVHTRVTRHADGLLPVISNWLLVTLPQNEAGTCNRGASTTVTAIIGEGWG